MVKLLMIAVYPAKNIVEDDNAALKRLQLEYMGLVFTHRPDPEIFIEEQEMNLGFDLQGLRVKMRR